jgi:hypothetical protein
MLQRYFHDVNRKQAEQLVEKSQELFIIRRTSDEQDDPHTLYIYSDRGEEEDKKSEKAFWYAITFKIVNEKGAGLAHRKFKSYETDPDKLNNKLYNTCSALLNDLKGVAVLDNTDPEASSKSPCELVSVHRNVTLRPEEMIKVRHVLSHHGALIISTQTPEKELKEGAQSGKTGIEMRKILLNSQFNTPVVIITGHGEIAGEEVGGIYASPSMFSRKEEKLDITMTPEQYVSLLIQGGLKQGDSIFIVLNVCYGGARQEIQGETIQYTSFAEKLAMALLEKGITSGIIASKTIIERFTGEYFEGEEPGKSMYFRVAGGSKNLRLVGGNAKGVQMQKEFTEPFMISSEGINFVSKLQKKEKASQPGGSSSPS